MKWLDDNSSQLAVVDEVKNVIKILINLKEIDSFF